MPKSPYTYPHKSREAKIDYICGIGGYSIRDGRWPLEFNVASYRADFSFDHLWKTYYKEYTPDVLAHDPEACTSYYRLAKRLHKEQEDNMWGWGQEDAARNVQDADAYRMLWDGTEVDVELELHGRGGKHLVLTCFNGHKLEGNSPEDLHDEMMAQTRPDGYTHVEYGTLVSGASWDNWSTADINLFYKYVRQCEVDFTVEKASLEVEYQGAFCFFNNFVNPAWEEALTTAEAHSSVVSCAQTLRRYLGEREGSAVLQMLRVLSLAAGVTEEELWSGE